MSRVTVVPRPAELSVRVETYSTVGSIRRPIVRIARRLVETRDSVGAQ